MNEGIDPAWFLGPEGPIAQQLPGYEVRPQQVDLARAVQRAFNEPCHLIAEAGTGVGKSFSYLACILDQVAQKRKKLVISTYTIALQEQLMTKDIPFLRRVCGDMEFTAVLAKGRGNYLCWRRLEQAHHKQFNLFDSAEDINALEEIRHWALATRDGSLSDLPFTPPHGVWEMVCSESHACMGRKCGHFNTCFYQLTRRRLFGADIIIANHALLFSDLSLKAQGGSLLPKYERLVLDEAHNIEHVASDHFGLRLTNHQVSYLLNRIYNPRTQKGLLAAYQDEVTRKNAVRAAEQAESFFHQVLNFHDLQEAAQGNGRVMRPETFVNVLRAPLNELGMGLKNRAEALTDEQEKLELDSYADRCFALGDELDLFVNQELTESVYWVEASRRRYRPMIAIHAAPLHIGAMMQKTLFDPCPSVILTSATLSTARQKPAPNEAAPATGAAGFDFFAARIGLLKFQGAQLGSPFDYEKQVQVFVEGYLPEPKNDAGEFMQAALAPLKKYLLLSEGHAFVLCTSFGQIRTLAKGLGDFCADHQMPLLEQGRDLDRSQLLHQFRQTPRSVLLGTDSFWQGVDVPGDALRNVIILKLPFAMPDHPLLQARLEQIRQRGGSPFFDYQLPEAILKFKQGFGRLIRTKTDTGIVAILDPRVVTKRYGRQFLNALPPCPVTIVSAPE